VAYADFDLKRAVRSFGLATEDRPGLFDDVAPIEPSDFLRDHIGEFAPIARGINTEQARRQYLISPILMDAKRQSRMPLNVLPGVPLAVDESKGLTGTCDYLIARSPEFYFVDSPVAAIAAAPREDMVAALGPCVAAMVAIRLFNERDAKPLTTVYGAVSTGSNWRFLRLDGHRLSIDRGEYYLVDLARILGILVAISRG
jgi:hypothetical protein